MTVENGEVKTRRYWDIDWSADTPVRAPLKKQGSLSAKAVEALHEGVIVLDDDDRTPVQTREFIATTSYDFILLMDGDSVPVRFDNVERLNFAKGRGLVRHERLSYAVNVDSTLVSINGFERLMRANHGY